MPRLRPPQSKDRTRRTSQRVIDPNRNDDLIDDNIVGDTIENPEPLVTPRTEPLTDLSALDALVDQYEGNLSAAEIDRFLGEFLPEMEAQVGRLPKFGEVFDAQMMQDLGFDVPDSSMMYEFERRADKKSGFGVLQVLPTGEKIDDRGYVWLLEGGAVKYDQWLADRQAALPDRTDRPIDSIREQYKETDPFYRQYAADQGWIKPEPVQESAQQSPYSPEAIANFQANLQESNRRYSEAISGLRGETTQDPYAYLRTQSPTSYTPPEPQSSDPYAYLRTTTEETAIRNLYPEAPRGEASFAYLNEQISTDPEGFVELVRAEGRSPITETLLESMGFSDFEMTEVFGTPQVGTYGPEYDAALEKIEQKLGYQFSVTESERVSDEVGARAQAVISESFIEHLKEYGNTPETQLILEKTLGAGPEDVALLLGAAEGEEQTFIDRRNELLAFLKQYNLPDPQRQPDDERLEALAEIRKLNRILGYDEPSTAQKGMEALGKTIDYGAAIFSPWVDKTAGASYEQLVEKQLHELPMWQQVVSELIAWAALPSAAALKVGASVLATRGGIRGAVGELAETALAPVAVAEAIPGKVVTAAFNKTAKTAFNPFLKKALTNEATKRGIELPTETLDNLMEAVYKTTKTSKLVRETITSLKAGTATDDAVRVAAEDFTASASKEITALIEAESKALVKSTGATAAEGIPTMITKAQVSQLKGLGYSDDAIAKMKHEEAQGILEKPQEKQPWEMARGEYAGGQFLAKGWSFTPDISSTIEKHGLLASDESILRLFGGNGALTKEWPDKQADRISKLQMAGYLERKYKDEGPSELIAKGFPVDEVDRFILSEKGKAALDDVNNEMDRQKAEFKQRIEHHEGAIKQALSEGKPVPPEVLKDYPELTPKAPEGTKPVSKEPERVAMASKAPKEVSTKKVDELQVKLDDLDSRIAKAKENIKNLETKSKETYPKIVEDTKGQLEKDVNTEANQKALEFQRDWYSKKLTEAKKDLKGLNADRRKLQAERKVIGAKLKGEEKAVQYQTKIQDLKERFKERIVDIELKQLDKEMERQAKETLIDEMRNTLVQYAKQELPSRLRHRILNRLSNVNTPKQLEKAMDLVDKYAQRPKRIEEARAISKAAKGPNGTIESLPSTKQKALELYKGEMYDAIQTSPMDVASTRYLKTGDFKQYLDAMPSYPELKINALHDDLKNALDEIEALKAAAPTNIDKKQIDRIITGLKGGEKINLDDVVALGIASSKGEGGKVSAAIRKSGFFVSDDFARYQNFHDVPYVQGYWMDPTRLTQAIDGGFFNGMLQREMMWPTKRTYLASQQYISTNKVAIYEMFKGHDLWGAGKKKLRKKAWEVAHHIGSEDVVLTTEKLLTKPEIAEVVKGLTNQQKINVIDVAVKSRNYFDNVLDQQNAVRTKEGRPEIPKAENYATWMADRSIWAQIMGKKVAPADMFNSTPPPDFIEPDAPFNPRAEARTHGLEQYAKEEDLAKLMFRYSETAGKDIFYTPIIQNAKIHASWLKNQGYPSSASLIEDWVSEVYAGKVPVLSRGVRKVVPQKVLKPAFWVRRQLTRAVFPLNWKWNLFIQTSSIALTFARYGMRSTVMGLEYLINPAVNKAVKENAYSHKIKSQVGGKVSYQDLEMGTAKSLKIEGGIIDKAESYANILTNVFEDRLTGISVRAAYNDGLHKGFEANSRELWEYASEGGAKTQSMYNFQDTVGVLRNKEVGTLVPFQTFAFEVLNTVREFNIIGVRKIGGRAGAWQTTSANSATGKSLISKRLIMLAEWIAAASVINAVADKYINRKPWSLSSFIPFYTLITQGMNAGDPWGQELPTKYTNDFKRAVDDVIKYEDFNRLRDFMIRYHMIGGTQINRTLEGAEALIKGEVQNSKGETLFEVNDPSNWDIFRALMEGPYALEEGQDYIDELNRNTSVVDEILVFEVAERVNIGDTVNKAKKELGQEDEYGDVYEASNLMSDIGKLRTRVGERRWDDSNNEFVQARKDYDTADDTYKTYGSEKPININTDPAEGQTLEDYIEQWQERLLIESEDELREFDKLNPDAELGNLSLRTLDLLGQYRELDEEDQREFLREHPEVNITPRDAWLKKNPKENAILAIWGKAKVLSREAFNIGQGLIEKYDIPDSAIVDYFPNKTIVDQGLFEYYKNAAMYAPNSAEAMLTLLDLQDEGKHELITFLDREMPEKPREYYEITTKHRAEDDEYEGYGQFNSPHYISDDDERAEARDAFLQGNGEYRIARIRRDALGADLPDNLIKNHVEYSELPSGGYAKERYLDEHRDYYKEWLQMGEGHAEVDFGSIPNKKYDDLLMEHGNLTEIKNDDLNNSQLAIKYEMSAYKNLFPDKQVKNYVKWYTDYQKKPEGHEGTWYEDDWFLMENPDFVKTMLDEGVWTKERDFSKVPTREVLRLYEQYQKLDEGADRLAFRQRHRDLNKWGHEKFGWKLDI